MIMKNHLIAKLLILFIIGLSMAGCEKDTEINQLSADQAHKLINLTYGTDARNKMDVYLPANRTAETPIVILIHGGAWISGDKSIFTSMQDTLLARGIASVNMNYRYVSSSVHNTQLMEDIDKVVKYCIDNSDKWQTRKSKIIIGGHSAGGHMSLMYGYTSDSRGAIGGVVSISGPTNLYDEQYLKMIQGYSVFMPMLILTLEQLADADYMEGQPVSENFRKISPITQIKNVPTLMIHGTNDELVAYQTVVAFEAELKNKGVVHKLYTIESADHSFNNISNTTRVKMNSEISDWIFRYGK